MMSDCVRLSMRKVKRTDTDSTLSHFLTGDIDTIVDNHTKDAKTIQYSTAIAVNDKSPF